MRNELCAPPSGAAELGPAAQAGVRARPGALPELRWRAQDHRGDLGAAGHRKDPHALGSAGPGAASGASPWPGAANCLRLPTRDRSSDPATRAAAVGCVRVVGGPTEAARRQAITRRRHQRETHFGWAINARQLASRSQPVSKGGFKRDGCCGSAHAAEFGVPWGGKRAFEKPIPYPAAALIAVTPPLLAVNLST